MADKVDSYFNILGSKHRLFFFFFFFNIWESDPVLPGFKVKKLESQLGLLLKPNI